MKTAAFLSLPQHSKLGGKLKAYECREEPPNLACNFNNELKTFTNCIRNPEVEKTTFSLFSCYDNNVEIKIGCSGFASFPSEEKKAFIDCEMVR